MHTPNTTQPCCVNRLSTFPPAAVDDWQPLALPVARVLSEAARQMRAARSTGYRLGNAGIGGAGLSFKRGTGFQSIFILSLSVRLYEQ